MDITKASSDVSALSKLYPQAAGMMNLSFNDLQLVQRWDDLEVLELPSVSRCAFRGIRPGTDFQSIVVPCVMAERLTMTWIKGAFEDLNRPSEIFLSISTDDSSVVYYKVSRGFTKPPL